MNQLHFFNFPLMSSELNSTDNLSSAVKVGNLPENEKSRLNRNRNDTWSEKFRNPLTCLANSRKSKWKKNRRSRRKRKKAAPWRRNDFGYTATSRRMTHYWKPQAQKIADTLWQQQIMNSIIYYFMWLGIEPTSLQQLF